MYSFEKEEVAGLPPGNSLFLTSRLKTQREGGSTYSFATCFCVKELLLLATQRSALRLIKALPVLAHRC
jgi:hypothetical protein